MEGRSELRKWAGIPSGSRGTQEAPYPPVGKVYSLSMMVQLHIAPWWLRRKRVCPQCGRPRFDLLVGKIPMEKEMATHSNILAWRIPWTEEPGGLQPTGSKSWTQLSDFISLMEDQPCWQVSILNHLPFFWKLHQVSRTSCSGTPCMFHKM